jgi:GT2 family glycosyltransferase
MVSVIVVSAGVGGYLKECLNSLMNQVMSADEIIVIDNSLKPGFAQEISDLYPAVKVCPVHENLFYCQALNKGIMLSKGDFLLCLNDDVSLDKEFIELALKGFSLHPMIGMVSGKILRRQKEIIDSTGLFLTAWRTAKERGYGCLDRGQFQKPGYIFGVNGAVAFYRRAMLEEIREGTDYFDPGFHIFYEDLDIAWRAQSRGWQGYYQPDAIAYHVRGGTVRVKGGRDKPYARRFLSDNLHLDLLKNRYLAIIKNESAVKLLLHLPVILLYELILWVYLILFRPRVIKLFFLNLKYFHGAFKRRKISFSRR